MSMSIDTMVYVLDTQEGEKAHCNYRMTMLEKVTNLSRKIWQMSIINNALWRLSKINNVLIHQR